MLALYAFVLNSPPRRPITMEKEKEETKKEGKDLPASSDPEMELSASSENLNQSLTETLPPNYSTLYGIANELRTITRTPRTAPSQRQPLYPNLSSLLLSPFTPSKLSESLQPTAPNLSPLPQRSVRPKLDFFTCDQINVTPAPSSPSTLWSTPWKTPNTPSFFDEVNKAFLNSPTKSAEAMEIDDEVDTEQEIQTPILPNSIAIDIDGENWDMDPNLAKYFSSTPKPKSVRRKLDFTPTLAPISASPNSTNPVSTVSASNHNLSMNPDYYHLLPNITPFSTAPSDSQVSPSIDVSTDSESHLLQPNLPEHSFGRLSYRHHSFHVRVMALPQTPLLRSKSLPSLHDIALLLDLNSTVPSNFAYQGLVDNSKTKGKRNWDGAIDDKNILPQRLRNKKMRNDSTCC